DGLDRAGRRAGGADRRGAGAATVSLAGRLRGILAHADRHPRDHDGRGDAALLRDDQGVALALHDDHRAYHLQFPGGGADRARAVAQAGPAAGGGGARPWRDVPLRGVYTSCIGAAVWAPMRCHPSPAATSAPNGKSMSRYKFLKSIAHNLGHSFLSLMNYVEGDYIHAHLFRAARMANEPH